ncbi:methyl-accepting chemotaxis protein [Natronobiforma cellulositropha]|uniref:methyl-accepting chemotaxis protein n=1 Tax=Natronobiforma cellulositropha TaxID=1679076 RepID=UPI0021D58417|nr:methyl-accepting chemotaxis protein [Natronobiforma cellulositropha]
MAIYTQTSSALEEDTQQQINQSTLLQAETLTEWVDRMTYQTQSLSETAALTDGANHEIRGALSNADGNSHESVTAVHYIETGSYEILESSNTSATGVAFSEYDVRWAEQGLEFDNTSHTQFTTPFEDPVTGEQSIAFVSPVDGDSGHAVMFVVDLIDYSSLLMRPSDDEGSHTFVANSEGTVVMSHHTHSIGDQNMGQDEFEAQSPPVLAALDGVTGYEEMEMHGHGEEMAMGFTRIEGTDWVVMTHIPTEAAYSLQGTIENSVIALVLVSVLGLGAIGVVIGRDTAGSLNHLSSRAQELEQGNLETELSTTRRDEIGTLYAAFESMRVSLRETITEAEAAREQAIHRERELAELAKQLEEEASVVMADAADGDLTERMSVEGDNEAMSQVVTEYNEMMSGIEGTVEELKHFATDVAAHSEQMTASVEEVEAASEQVTKSVQEISSHTDHQHATFQQVEAEMGSIAAMTDDIASLSQTVTEAAEQTADTGSDGRVAAREVKEAIARIDAESQETIDEIEKLQAEMDRIEAMAEFISEVATQTNVLALNANIEATRTSSESDGFSAVAGEVKSLASDAKDSAQKIETVVGSIQEQMGRTATEVEQTRAEIDASAKTIDEASTALEEIAEHADTTHEGVREIASLTQQQASSTQEVTEMVVDASTISDKVSEEAETVAAAAEEQTSSLHEVSHSANDLAGEAHSLQFSLDQFETDADLDGETDEERPPQISSD